MSPADILSSPVVQYGFAGFCLILLGVIVWLIKSLLGVLRDTNKVIAANTEAIDKLGGDSALVLSTVKSLYEKLLSRPCIARREDGGGR